MSVLSDGSILSLVACKVLGIEPFTPEHVGPAGYDLMLNEHVVLEPGESRLTSSLEYITMPDNVLGELMGRSSVARQFVLVHVSSGPLEPGWEGNVTFEMVNLGKEWRTYRKGDRIAQVKFSKLDAPAMRPYHGRYQGQRGITESRFEHGDD